MTIRLLTIFRFDMKAFPTPTLEIGMKGDVKGYQHGNEGMDLRDYFAAKAMQALVLKTINDNENSEVAAEAAYMFADAMINERNKNDN